MQEEKKARSELLVKKPSLYAAECLLNQVKPSELHDHVYLHAQKDIEQAVTLDAGHRTDLLNEEEQTDSNTSMKISTIEENDHHILDLLLSESFSDAELGLDQPLVPTTYNSEERGSCINNDIETNVKSREVTNLQDLEESLMSNPEKEEINNVLISQDVIESLVSVKHVALIALDSLLRQIVADHNSHIMESEIRSTHTKMDSWRKRSFSFSHSLSQNTNHELDHLPQEERNSWIRSQLLADIAHNATKLSIGNEMLQTDSIQQYSPDVATLDIIRRQLNSSSSVILSDDYSLACTLAALLGYLYRILELCDPKNPNQSSTSELPNIIQTSEEILQSASSEDIYSTLHKEVTNLQSRRASLNIYKNVTDERLATWNEIDRLMEIVASLCHERSNNDPPPEYSNNLTEEDNEAVVDPPKYPLVGGNLKIKIDNEKTKLDLDNVISAIDRVYNVAPQLNNQRVELNSRQKKRLTAAALSNVIQKLSRGRLEGQRVDSSSIVKYQTLNRLVDQINKAAERSFVDQRVELSPRQIRQHEVAKLNGIIERLEKNRMTNQDWHSPEQLLIQDLTRLTNELTKTSVDTIYTSQRYKLSPDKERDMFMNSIIKKVEKMQSYRMEDQDAESPTERKERAWKEIENVLTKQEYSPSMNYQRATLTPKKQNFS
ncbi:6904_t:CDS:2 [Cetraspora pellucida]|uniref:6904_t:CDS:1 n=1 Tax=Cetraspora pellucida TaxID=1433469 RepID=A0A9N8ZST1_9GLOM|nr:6904_t:CDS:2 [Cetraspora pellucida]